MTLNGNEDSQLPEDRMKTVQAGLTFVQQIQAERDRLREELRVTREMVTRQQVEIDSLHQLQAMLESHMQTYMIQRDEAVAHRAAYETLFATVQAQLRVFNLPAQPLVKEVQNEKTQPVDLSGMPDTSHTTDEGSGQRAAVSHASASKGEIPRRTPVLAHEGPLLGQRAGGAKRPAFEAGSLRPRSIPADPTAR